MQFKKMKNDRIVVENAIRFYLKSKEISHLDALILLIQAFNMVCCLSPASDFNEIYSIIKDETGDKDGFAKYCLKFAANLNGEIDKVLKEETEE